jgi:hypothetical protein
MRDDSYIQAQQEQEYQEWLYETASEEHKQYLEVLAKGDEYERI